MAGRRLLSVLMPVVGAALLVAAGVVWSAESATTGAAAEARKGGTLRLSFEGDVDYVDPALAYSPESYPLLFATCAKLFNYPDAPGAAGTRLVPEVVRTTRVSRDGRVYTFDLKRTFRFHTGEAVTARSFADAFKRDAKPRQRSPATEYMTEIVGAAAASHGKAEAISGIRVLGRYRLQFSLTRPVGGFTALLTMPFFCPILPNTPIAPQGINDPPGSGPYYVAERIVNRRIVLKRNPYYRGGRPANVDQVVWTVGETSETCLRAAEHDRVDQCWPPGRAQRRLAEQYGINRPGGQFLVTPTLKTFYIAFNHDRPAFKGAGQIPLKKAINYAVDRVALSRAGAYVADLPTDQMLPPELGRDDSIYPLKANPATARVWLARAGRKPGTLVLYAYNGPDGVAVAQVLRSNLKQIGIDLEVKYYGFPEVVNRAATRGEPFDLVYNGWFADYPDPANFLEPLLSPAFPIRAHTNYSYFKNRRVSARVDAASRLRGAARREAWADLDADLMRTDPPWAPLFQGRNRMFVSRSHGCSFVHPVYDFDIAASCKK